MKFAPSYIAAIVAILFNLQSFLDLSFTSDEITTGVTIVCGIIVAVRQIVTGKSTPFGGRPQN